jgi:hypothetical protein
MDIEYKKRNFFNTAIADIYRAIDGKCYVGSFILTFCLIDQLTWIEFGNGKRGFNEWIIKRLKPLNIFYSEKDEELYSVRNGLVHSYGPSRKILSQEFEGYELRHCDPATHLQKVNNGIIKVCLYSLLTETVYAAHLTFEGLKISGSSEQLKRLNNQIAILRTDPPVTYGSMHRALSVFDNPENITLKNIQSDYTKTILYPGV